MNPSDRDRIIILRGMTMKRARQRFLPILLLATAGLLSARSVFAQEDPIAKWISRLKEYPPSSGAVEMEKIKAFPTEDEGSDENYLWDPRAMALDPNGCFYIIDEKTFCIFKYDDQGRFLKKAGRKGQGPGEFQIPVDLRARDGRLYVCDNGKHEIMVFDTDLKFLTSFITRKSYLGIAITSQGLICGTPLRMTREDRLIDIMDQEGNLLRSFGPCLFGNEKRWQTHNFAHIDVDSDDEILLAFMHYPTVCRYDLNGKMLARYEIPSAFMKYAGQQNDKMLNNPSNRMTWMAMRGLYVLGKRFFLLQGPYTGILEFDERGRQVKEYWKAISYDFMAMDFAVQRTDATYISLLASNPTPGVSIYKGPK